MPNETILETRHLAKRYGEVRAVDGIDMHVRRGEIYGFLGRNGAGKTTTIRMMLGLIRPTGGEVRLLGERIKPGTQRVFRRVGYLVEDATAYANLTVRENLEIQRRLTGSPRGAVNAVIDHLRLREYADRRAGRLSLGNKQRLALARALLHEPDILLLDEPVNGLDPAGIVEIRTLLRRLADEREATVFLSSHILAEVSHLADRIGIVHEGHLIEELGYRELRERSRAYLELAVSDPERATRLLTERLGSAKIERAVDGALHVFDPPDSIAQVARLLVTEGIELTRFCQREEDLEEHFLSMTGGGA